MEIVYLNVNRTWAIRSLGYVWAIDDIDIDGMAHPVFGFGPEAWGRGSQPDVGGGGGNVIRALNRHAKMSSPP